MLAAELGGDVDQGSDFVIAGGEGLGIPSQGTVSTTLRRKGPGPRKGSAKEPDFGFYFRENELRMRSKDVIDLEIDPPPDLVLRERVALDAGGRVDPLGQVDFIQTLGVLGPERNAGDLLALRAGFAQEHPERGGARSQVESKREPGMCPFECPQFR